MGCRHISWRVVSFPYPVVQGGAAGTVPIITIQFRPYGVKLEFTGTIEDDGVIRLKVAPEVSSLDYSNTVTIAGFILPAISTRRAETEVELKDGQSFGIAGLLDDRTTIQLSKVPGIGDIPILGQLFRSRSTNRYQHRTARTGYAHHCGPSDRTAAQLRSRRLIRRFNILTKENSIKVCRIRLKNPGTK